MTQGFTNWTRNYHSNALKVSLIKSSLKTIPCFHSHGPPGMTLATFLALRGTKGWYSDPSKVLMGCGVVANEILVTLQSPNSPFVLWGLDMDLDSGLLKSFQMKITWLEGKSLHKGSPRTQRPMNVDRGVRGTDTEMFLKTI